MIGAFGHRQAVYAAQVQQAEVVLADLFYPNVSTGRGDADQFSVRACQQVNQRNGIVYTGVYVGENWCGGHRGNDTGRSYQCTPGTRRTARLTGPGSRMRATAARAGRFGRRDGGCPTTVSEGASPRAAAESG
jgi:hypothetical protein